MLMLSTNDELDQVASECYSMVSKRAALSALAAASPLPPRTEIAADFLILSELLLAINRRFGLTPDQIDQYDAQTKMALSNLMLQLGSRFAGKVITTELVMTALKKMGIRIRASAHSG
jgi:hypothetical protein